MNACTGSLARLFSSWLLAVAPLSAFAQIAPGDLDAINQAIEEQQITDAPIIRPPAFPPSPGQSNLDLPTPPEIDAAPGGPCFVINTVNIAGWEAIGIRPSAQDALVGRCVTAQDVGQILNEINVAYQDAGLTTTRGYLPEQDVNDGILDIIIVPGRIEGFVYADGRPADRRLEAAFPSEAGDLLNLRDLEQGFDNLRAPRSAAGELSLLPGTTPGDSIVAISLEDDRPWHLDFSISNRGQESTGEVLASFDFAYDNLLGLNETIRLTTGTPPVVERERQYSDNASLSISLPLGHWSHFFALNGSRYRLPVDGINQGYSVDGESRGATWSSSYMLFRDQTRTLRAYGGLDISESRSSIEGFEIRSQRRNSSVGNLGLRGEHTLTSGQLRWDLGARFGLDAFGAEAPSASIVEQDFLLWQGSVDYSRPIFGNGVSYSTRLVGQYSDHVLAGSEQFSIGGWSTVRGFHADSMYGDSGFYLHNTLHWAARSWDWGDLTLSAGLDGGYVIPSALRAWDQRHLVGISLGSAFKIGTLGALTIDLAQALSRPDDNLPDSSSAFEDNPTVARIALNVEF